MREVSGEFVHGALQAFAEMAEDMGRRCRQRAVYRAAAGVKMPSSAKALGYTRNVEFSLAAQGEPDTVVRELAQEYGDLDASDTDGIVHKALAVFFGRACTLHIVMRHPHPGETAFAMQIGERRAEQEHFGGGVGEISVLSDERGVGAMTHQI